MSDKLAKFEDIVRRAQNYTDKGEEDVSILHPFEKYDIHEAFPDKVKALFDNGHYSESAFEAFKFLGHVVRSLASETKDGKALMLAVFNPQNPLIALNSLTSTSDQDEQEGYRFLFAGSILAVRNPRAHEYGLMDTPDKCLDHLILASLLLRRLEEAGYTV